MGNKSGYELSRTWFDFAFENQQCKCIHTALFMWIVELNNRLGWKKEFGLPTSVTMEGLSIGNRGTYKNALEDLEKWGFIKVVQKAKNASTACVIEIRQFRNEQAVDQALDQAMIRQSTGSDASSVRIDKQVNNKTKKQINQKRESPPKNNFINKAKNSFENTGCEFGNSFKNAWLELIQEPNWKSKSQNAINKSLKNLMKYDEDFSIRLVNAAIAGGWKGVTFPDTDEKYQTFKKTGTFGYKSKAQLQEENRLSVKTLSERSEEFLRLFGSDI